MGKVAKRLLTAEEFMKMPDPKDGSQQELLRGEIITMPPPQGKHGLVCLRIGRLIGNHVDSNKLGFVTSNDSGFISERDPDSVRGPDIAFWSRERLPVFPEDGYLPIAPDLAIEVLSPSDRAHRISEKLLHYMKTGVRLVLQIDPVVRTVLAAILPNEHMTFEEGQIIEPLRDMLPGLEIAVSDLFD